MSISSIYSHYKGFYLSNTQISQSSILVSSGEISPFNAYWDISLGYKNVNSKYVLIETNKSLYSRIDTVIAKPNICEINGNYASIDIQIIKGIPSQNPLPINEFLEPGMFLGWVLVPGQFPVLPSILCTRSFNYSENSVIKSEYPNVVISQILSSVEEWQQNKLYFYGQLVKSNNSIFIALYSHGSNLSIDSDLEKGYWKQIIGDDADIEQIIRSILTTLVPEYIKHPSQPEFSIQFNVQNQFNGSDKLKWNTQFNQMELNGGLVLKNQNNNMQVPTDGINIYTKTYGISPSKHVEGVVVDESGTERTIFTVIT